MNDTIWGVTQDGDYIAFVVREAAYIETWDMFTLGVICLGIGLLLGYAIAILVDAIT